MLEWDLCLKIVRLEVAPRIATKVVMLRGKGRKGGCTSKVSEFSVMASVSDKWRR